ncbi:MAG TPA: hypothetical protein VE130_04190 [Nitrososphaeraceae archaeon]|nr:hypothetical protein [Nitrososphaeraceae archaeon]
MKGWKDNKSTINNLSDRLDRLEAEIFIKRSDAEDEQQQRQQQGLEKLTSMERYILNFNRSVKEVMPYYKAEVMQVHSISSEEYDKRTLEGDESIYLPQPNRKFESTSYAQRVAHVLGLDYEGLQLKINQGEIKDMIATGGFGCWRDENPNAVF